MGNRIGRGRESFWPASPGRLNRHQIQAAVRERNSRYRRTWKTHMVFNAPNILREIRKYDGPDFTVDTTGPPLIRNSDADQFDNEYTLLEADALYLIELMCWYAQGRLDGPDRKTNRYPWERVPDTQFTVRDNGTSYLQVYKDGNVLCQAGYYDGEWIVPNWSFKSWKGHGYETMMEAEEAVRKILPDGGLAEGSLQYRVSIPQPQPSDTAPTRPVKTPDVPEITGEIAGGTYNERIEKIANAILHYPVDGRRTKRQGKPFVTGLEKTLGFDITAKERNAAWRKFLREVEVK